MSDKKEQKVDSSRREFLEKTGKAAVVAPAAGLLLAVNSKKSMAQVTYGQTPPPPPPPTEL